MKRDKRKDIDAGYVVYTPYIPLQITQITESIQVTYDDDGWRLDDQKESILKTRRTKVIR